MEDMISRKAAIDALGGNEPVGDPSKMDDYDVVKMWERIRIINIIYKLPSAQPETHDKRTKTHACDLIDRQAAIDTLDKHLRTTDVPVSYPGIISALTEWLNELPSAQADLSGYSDKLWKAAYERGKAEAQQRWIPCSERLPDEYGEYRITWVTSLAPSKRFIGDSEYEVTSVWDEERKGFKGEWLLDDYIKHYPDVKVIAWKPLEEPYRGEGEK